MDCVLRVSCDNKCRSLGCTFFIQVSHYWLQMAIIESSQLFIVIKSTFRLWPNNLTSLLANEYAKAVTIIFVPVEAPSTISFQ